VRAAALAIALLLTACQWPKAETPPQVAGAYQALVAGLDERTPGASFARARDFARANRRYAVAAVAEKEVDAWRAKLEPAYRRARDLAREDRFDEAEAMLRDLAPLEEERAGRLARDFLGFGFQELKASRLLAKGDARGAAAAARELRDKPLTESQVAAAERLLDSAATVDQGVRLTRTTAFRSAARAVHVLLFSIYAEEGRYPAELALDSPRLASLHQSGLLASVAAIEGYSAGSDTFTLVLVGRDPTERVRVTESGIE
jgi:hypothetical protein